MVQLILTSCARGDHQHCDGTLLRDFRHHLQLIQWHLGKLSLELTKIFQLFWAILAQKPQQTFPVVNSQGDFEVNVSIILYYRWSNDYFDKETHFKKLTSIQTIDAPFPGGGVTGEQVYSEIAAVEKDKKFKIFARSVKNDPFTWRGSIEVSNSKNEYYNNYVCADKDGQLYMFLDLRTE